MQRWRVPLGFVCAALFFVLGRPRLPTLAIGGAVAVIGLALRAWASGYLRKNDQLATSGPYAHTRNPLYFGSFLIAAGFALVAHWALLLLVVAFWVIVYGPTIRRERRDMSARFPEAYASYARNVPAFVPRLRA